MSQESRLIIVPHASMVRNVSSFYGEGATVWTLNDLLASAIPQTLLCFTSITLHYVVQLQPSELDCFFALAEAGLPVTFLLPLDARNQGIGGAVTQLATQIEARHRIDKLAIKFVELDAPGPIGEFAKQLFVPGLSQRAYPGVHVVQAADLFCESMDIARRIHAYRQENRACRIAIGVRSFDATSKRLIDILTANQIPIAEDHIQVVPVESLCGIASSWDIVFLPQLMHGRFPQTPVDEVVLPYDDPLNPSIVPLRQQLEPLYFVMACLAARQGLVLSCSKTDVQNYVVAPSEFFEAAQRLLPVESANSPFAGGMIASLVQKCSDTDEQFHISAERLNRLFAKRLGTRPDGMMTATRLERLAECRFRGFVQDFLRADVDSKSGHDLDARLLGRFVHDVLERFFSARSNAITLELDALVEEVANATLRVDPVAHPAVIEAHIIWAHSALARLISNITNKAPLPNAVPTYFELKVDAVPIQVGGQTLYFGGVVDRVDEGPQIRVIVDYKTQPTQRLNEKVKEDELLVHQFQLPLYARFMEHQYPTSEDTHYYAYLASVRDGSFSPVLGQNRMADFRSRVTDDNAADGLGVAISAVLEPVLKGHFNPDIGTRCAQCRLDRVCRTLL